MEITVKEGKFREVAFLGISLRKTRVLRRDENRALLPAPDGCDESGFDIPTNLLEKVISEVPF